MIGTASENDIDVRPRLLKLADSYLDHIRIAVEAGDEGGPFRDFIDNWAAFDAEANHHRNTRNRVIWFNNPDAIGRRPMLLSLPFRSAGADAILQLAAETPGEYRERQKAKDGTIRLMVDHAVPLTVMVKRLFQPEADLSREALRKYLRRWYHLGLLTSAEDAKLNGLGLRSQMPKNWNGEDLIARYRAADIITVVEPSVAPDTI
jgi:hypothetical protein